jgi:hypothetical protein
MRLLLDENLPRRLKRQLAPHDVRTVQDMGWHGIKNGKLLRLAQISFEALITIDQNLIYQQHIASFNLGLLILHAPSNRFSDLAPLITEMIAELTNVRPGTAVHVGSWRKHG